MGLLNKIFKGPDKAAPESEAAATGTRFEESEGHDDDDSIQREASRRELIKLVLRESMRRHAVPSDWIECRILPVVNSRRRSGVHLQLVVKQGQARLLNYIPPFQSSLMAEIEKYDPRAWDWLLSISWQFDGITSSSGGVMPGAADWTAKPSDPFAPATSPVPAEAPPAQEEEDDPEIAEDLRALFAIRDAVLKSPPDKHHDSDFEETKPTGFTPSGPDQLR
ncbi:hypothetical protein ACPWT1_18165 [Ramlibacter sp. MMS24-I3-19]|uniref:hypothetical protein n=1 Tax=Ramlibacter sp. MMS24-I3-19 TaxID=3416606 RepID=UPI003D02BC07